MEAPSAVSALDSIIGSFAVVALMVVALETIVGLVRPADSLRHCGGVIGIVIVVVLLVSLLVGLWSTMSLWHRVVLAGVALFMWQMRRGQRPPRRRKAKE